MFNKIKEKNISNSFEASLSFAGEEKVAEYSLAKEDQVIEKYAGIDIYQPTVDNVEQFVRKYIMNETSFFPKTLEIHTILNPSTFDSVHQEYVKEATGIVSVKLHDAKLELPFIVTDGELVPFDVIQMSGQRIPYSRENMRRVLFGIDKQFADKVNGAHGNAIGEFSPYVKTEKPANPSTSPGFLGNVLQIQEQHIRRNGDSTYITASQSLDEGLEKLATMQKLTMKEVEALHNEFKKQASIEFKGQLDKFAAEIDAHDDRAELKLFSNINELQFENACSLPNGTFISFPEKMNKEMSMTKGIVVDNYMSISGRSFKASKVVVAEDGRVKFLDNNEKFLCFKGDAKFSLPQTSLSAVKQGDAFMAFNGDKALPPSVCCDIGQRGLTNSKTHGVEFKVIEAETANNSSALSGLMNDVVGSPLMGSTGSSGDKALKRFRIAPLEGAKFTEMSYKDYINKLSEQTGIDPLTLSSSISKYSVKIDYSENDTVLCADLDTVKVIKVTGTIENYMRDKNDMRKMVETTGEFSMPKTAGQGETVYIKLIDKDRRVYFVQIKYIDKSKAMFNQMTKEYRDVPEQGVKQILRVLGFDGGQGSEMLFKTREMGSVTMNLPSTARVDMLTGANVINRSTDQVKNVMKKVVSPDAVGDAVMSSVLGALMTGALKSRGAIGSGTPDSAREALRFAAKFASEAEALSVAFEKVAQEHQNKSMLKVAKLMSEGALLHNKVAEVLGGTCYPRLTEAAFDIAQGKDELERVACDLMELKYNQYHNGDHIVNPNYIQGAILALDNMYKVACELSLRDEKYAEKLAEFREECKAKNKADKKRRESIAERNGWNVKQAGEVCEKCGNPVDKCICGGKETEKKAELFQKNLNKDLGQQIATQKVKEHFQAAGLDVQEKKADFRDDNGFNIKELQKKKEKSDNKMVCQQCGKERDEKTNPHCSCGHDHTVTKKEYYEAKRNAEKQADEHYLEPQSDDVSALESEINPVESDNNDEGVEGGLDNTETDDIESQKTAGALDGTINDINKSFKSKWTNLANKHQVDNGVIKPMQGISGHQKLASEEKQAGFFKHEDFTPEEEAEFDALYDKMLNHKLYATKDIKRFKELRKKLTGFERMRIEQNQQRNMGAYNGAKVPQYNPNMKTAGDLIDQLAMEKQANIFQQGAKAAKGVSSGLGATYGAIGGAALGAGAGAIGAEEGHRAEGALKGGALGAVTGGATGAVGGHALAQGAAKTYNAGLKTGLGVGGVAGAGLGAAGMHMAQNVNPQTVKNMAQGVKDTFHNVVNTVKGEGGVVANEASAVNNLNKAKQEAAQNINHVEPQVMQQQPVQPQSQPVGQPVPQQPVQGIQPQAQPGAQTNINPQPQAQPRFQPQLIDQHGNVIQPQPQVQPVEHSIDVSQQPMPQTDSSTVEGITQGNYQQYELPQNGGQPVGGQPGAEQGQQAVGQHAQDGTQDPGVMQKAKQKVSNWWSNVRGNNPDTTNAVADTEEGIKNQASDVIELMYQEKLAFESTPKSATDLIDQMWKQAAMNSPTEEEKKNESNGEYALNDITCEVCGYKGQPESDGRCPTCGAIGGIKPSDPASKVTYGPDDNRIDDNNIRDQINIDLMAQGDSDTMDY